MVPHHLFGAISLWETLDAASYARLARERIALCWKQGRPPILVGGSGLYLSAVLRGLAQGLPAPDPELRARLESVPLEELCVQLGEKDPEALQRVDLLNPRRVIRALEVCLLTGRTFSSFRTPRETDTQPAGISLTLPRETLHERIASRASKLFEEGVAAEVRHALPNLGKTASQVIGLQQVASVLAGDLPESLAVVKIVEATRQYARRQETWFRKESLLTPTPPQHALENALKIAAQRISLVSAAGGVE
jgi:tRNA dimethylallyltransferase